MIDGELHFLSPTEQRRLQNFIQTIQSERQASDVYIRGIVWWDGRDPGGMHRPGEVVSKESFYGLMAAAFVSAGLIFQSSNSFIGNDRDHDQSGDRIGPPPSEKCIEKQPAKQDCR